VKVCAFIPARSGSKRIPNKNREQVGGVGLVDRAVRAAVGAGCEPVVSTDDSVIASWYTTAWLPPAPRVTVHERPSQLASDHAQIEDAVSHWWRRLDDKPDVVVILQPTSPFRTADHVRLALHLLEVSEADSVIGVTETHEHHFAGRLKPRAREVSGPHGFPAAHHFFDWQPFSPFAVNERPRTQDLAPRGHENGAVYVTRREAWERSGSRTSGHVVALPMTRWEGLDVDTVEDLEVARAIAERMGR
jgi:CMP-N,N'-diacetyllegionaminic acid synthase